VIPSRTIKLGYPKERGPNGRRLCRWCKKEVPKGRIHWCGQACVEEYLVRSNAGYARKKVEERDRGVCARCGLDTDQLKRVVRALFRRTRDPISPMDMERGKYFRWLKYFQGLHAWAGNTYRHLWEADHIVPVAEGGGSCGLDNLRTLCLGCHRKATAQLAARLAEKRRGAHQETLFTPMEPQ
jgi:5-methylcytosine-specific restriction protein A